MSYKTILVHVGPDQGLEQRTRAAAAIGARFGATVFGAGVVAWAPYIDPFFGVVDGETIQRLRDDVDVELREAETRFRAVLSDYLHPVVWRTSTAYPDQAVADLSAGADLIVACRPADHRDDRHFARPAALIMESGLPVLVLAPGVERLQPRTVMIAWKDTRETRRAVADALPFLKAAERVEIVAIREGTEAAEPKGLQDLIARLARHGVESHHDVLPHSKNAVSQELLKAAGDRKADLIVLGAFGHSRAQEWAFGGVTADLLHAANRSILFSR